MDREGLRLIIQHLFSKSDLETLVSDRSCLTKNTLAYFVTVEAYKSHRIRAIYTPNAGTAKIFEYSANDFAQLKKDKLKQSILRRIFAKHASYCECPGHKSSRNSG